MKKGKAYLNSYWREHAILLLLLTLIGVVLLFCHRCPSTVPCPCDETQRILPLPPAEDYPTNDGGDSIEDPEVDSGIGTDTISSGEIETRVRDAGGATGNLRVSLAWSTFDDLDLAIIQPNGVLINYEPQNSVDRQTGGVHDVDRNRASNQATREPVENVHWTTPLPGTYRILVHYYDHFSRDSSVPFVLNCVQGDAVIKEFSGRVFSKGQIVPFEFDYQP